MNYGFLYQPPTGEIYPSYIDTSPFRVLVVNPSYSTGDPFSDRLDATSILNVRGTIVDQLFGYLSLGRVQQGIQWFDQIGGDSRTAAPTETGGSPPFDIYDLFYWRQDTRDVLKSEITVQEAQGFTGIFLDDTDRYWTHKKKIYDYTESQGSTLDGNKLGNAILVTMDAVIEMADSTSLDVWANVNAYMIKDLFLVASGSNLQAKVDSFAAAVDGVVIENYWFNVHDASLSDYLGAVKSYADNDITVHVSSDFDLNPTATGVTAFSRTEVNKFFWHAALRGYMPTASVFDTSELDNIGNPIDTSAPFDQFYLGMPVFNQTSDDSDVLAALAGRGTLHGGGGADRLLGSDFNDWLNGGAGRDRLLGRDGNDVLRGDGGNDRLLGGDGRDTLTGGVGDDVLKGGKRSDWLWSDTGNDLLIGGGGRDYFNFHGMFGTDHVKFKAKDWITMYTRYNDEATSFAEFIAASKQVGADTVYDRFDDNINVIILENTVLDDLHSDQFRFFVDV